MAIPAAAPLASASRDAGIAGRGHVFLSHVREDSDDIDRLQLLFQAAGIPVWRDTSRLWPGDDRSAMIRDAITHDALAFIPCFSSHSVTRRTSSQNEELRLAINQLRLQRPNDPWMIPVRLDDCDIPNFDLGAGQTLASIEPANLFGPGREQAAGRLVAAVQRLVQPSPPLAARPALPVPPLVTSVAALANTITWIVEANPRLWLRSGPGVDCRTVGWLDYGQQARGNSAGAERAGITWYLLQKNDDGWAWGNSAYLRAI